MNIIDDLNYFAFVSSAMLLCFAMIVCAFWMRSVLYGIFVGVTITVACLTILPRNTEELLIKVRTDCTPRFTHVNNYNWHGEIQVYEYTAYYFKVIPYESKWQEAKFDGWRPEGDLKVYSVRNIFDKHLFYRYELLRPQDSY